MKHKTLIAFYLFAGSFRKVLKNVRMESPTKVFLSEDKKCLSISQLKYKIIFKKGKILKRLQKVEFFLNFLMQFFLYLAMVNSYLARVSQNTKIILTDFWMANPAYISSNLGCP